MFYTDNYTDSEDNCNMCYPSRENSIDEFLMEMVSLLDSHDRVDTMSDPDWLEIVGHPTIPHVKSLRQPPSNVALRANNENLIGITNKNASQRYLQKLRKERQRNQEVLTECVDNLPIVIRQMVYPDKPVNKDTLRIGTGHALHSREKKFRIGKNHNDYWHDNVNRWVKDDDCSPDYPPGGAGIQHTKKHRNGSVHSSSTEMSAALNTEFVHHQGFIGQSTQALKYKFPKKKGQLSSQNTVSQPKNTFRPKGFGSLYDELEFERRYKKVFDLNKHIHFVHSNFLNGQRIVKRTKLPPIGHVSSTQSDPTDGGDIFAIMSVQKYNHPEGYESRSLVTSARERRRVSADGFPERAKRGKHSEIAQEVDFPVGFIPGVLKPTGYNPFDGVKGSTPPEEISYRLPALPNEGDSALGTLTEENTNNPWGDESDASARTLTSKQTTNEQNSNELKVNGLKKKRNTKSEKDSSRVASSSAGTLDEMEPFNISVHVEIKQKDHNLTGGDDDESDIAREKLSPAQEINETSNTCSGQSAEKIIYPTKLQFDGIKEETVENELGVEINKVIRPKNVFITTNQLGITTQKVNYPDRFVLEHSLAEEDETEDAVDGNDQNCSEFVEAN